MAVFISSYTRYLKQSINCPRCYSLSLRYSIYKVQIRSAFNFLSAANFDILAHLVEFVKHFLQVFSNSFCAVCRPPGVRLSSDKFVMISQKLRFVKRFFLVFRSSSIHFPPPRGDLHILAQHPTIVKHFFTNSAPIFC